MVLSVQFKGTWFLCILGVFFLFVLYWLWVTVGSFGKAVRRGRGQLFSCVR